MSITSTVRYDLKEIHEALSFILEPGVVAELRYWGAGKGVISGYFDDFNKLAQAAANLSGEAEGVYITLNPINPDLLARSANHTTAYAKNLTCDDDVLRIEYEEELRKLERLLQVLIPHAPEGENGQI